MKINLCCLLGALALTGILSTASHARALDDVDVDVEFVVDGSSQAAEKRITVVAQAGGTHWIGVYAVPVEAALKSHLGIAEDRLIVQQVMDDSPAKKAGLQEHDILLKYGDASIATVDDLIKAVAEAGDKEASLSLIRGGKKTTLNVTAEKRPENQQTIRVDASAVGDVQGLIGSWVHDRSANVQGGSPLRFRVVGPGVVDNRINVTELHQALSGAKAKLPKSLTIEIKKEGDTPAQIKVTRDGETWEVTEENLDKLPEDVRPHVKGSLGGRAGVAVGFAPSVHGMRLKALQVRPGAPVIQEQAIAPVAPHEAPTARKIQILRQATESTIDVEQLRKDVEALQSAVKKLQGSKAKRSKKDKDRVDEEAASESEQSDN